MNFNIHICFLSKIITLEKYYFAKHASLARLRQEITKHHFKKYNPYLCSIFIKKNLNLFKGEDRGNKYQMKHNVPACFNASFS